MLTRKTTTCSAFLGGSPRSSSRLPGLCDVFFYVFIYLSSVNPQSIYKLYRNLIKNIISFPDLQFEAV